MILTSLEITPAEFEAGTGWAITPQGACNGDRCVPLPGADGGRLDVADAEHGLWALGPAAPEGRALLSAQAPELTLPDVDGRPFSLSSLRGRKVALIAWAPY